MQRLHIKVASDIPIYLDQLVEAENAMDPYPRATRSSVVRGLVLDAVAALPGPPVATRCNSQKETTR